MRAVANEENYAEGDYLFARTGNGLAVDAPHGDERDYWVGRILEIRASDSSHVYVRVRTRFMLISSMQYQACTQHQLTRYRSSGFTGHRSSARLLNTEARPEWVDATITDGTSLWPPTTWRSSMLSRSAARRKWSSGRSWMKRTSRRRCIGARRWTVVMASSQYVSMFSDVAKMRDITCPDRFTTENLPRTYQRKHHALVCPDQLRRSHFISWSMRS